LFKRNAKCSEIAGNGVRPLSGRSQARLCRTLERVGPPLLVRAFAAYRVGDMDNALKDAWIGFWHAVIGGHGASIEKAADGLAKLLFEFNVERDAALSVQRRLAARLNAWLVQDQATGWRALFWGFPGVRRRSLARMAAFQDAASVALGAIVRRYEAQAQREEMERLIRQAPALRVIDETPSLPVRFVSAKRFRKAMGMSDESAPNATDPESGDGEERKGAVILPLRRVS